MKMGIAMATAAWFCSPFPSWDWIDFVLNETWTSLSHDLSLLGPEQAKHPLWEKNKLLLARQGNAPILQPPIAPQGAIP